MGKYFGTDGFRGEANVNLTADHAFKVGRFLGWYFTQLRRRERKEGNPDRVDILRALNRMSSMLYLLMIQEKRTK